MEITIIRKEQNETWEEFQDRVNEDLGIFKKLGFDAFDVDVKELHDDVVAIIKVK